MSDKYNPTAKRKILISPGHGAGWTSWNTEDYTRELISHKGLIHMVEKYPREHSGIGPAGSGTHDKIWIRVGELHDHSKPDWTGIPKDLMDVLESISKEYPGTYFGGLRDITVEEVWGPVKVTEHDGYESYTTLDTTDWI